MIKCLAIPPNLLVMDALVTDDLISALYLWHGKMLGIMHYYPLMEEVHAFGDFSKKGPCTLEYESDAHNGRPSL